MRAQSTLIGVPERDFGRWKFSIWTSKLSVTQADSWDCPNRKEQERSSKLLQLFPGPAEMKVPPNTFTSAAACPPKCCHNERLREQQNTIRRKLPVNSMHLRQINPTTASLHIHSANKAQLLELVETQLHTSTGKTVAPFDPAMFGPGTIQPYFHGIALQLVRCSKSVQ